MFTVRRRQWRVAAEAFVMGYLYLCFTCKVSFITVSGPQLELNGRPTLTWGDRNPWLSAAVALRPTKYCFQRQLTYSIHIVAIRLLCSGFMCLSTIPFYAAPQIGDWRLPAGTATPLPHEKLTTPRRRQQMETVTAHKRQRRITSHLCRLTGDLYISDLA